ncbi:hypothetical protein B0H16DRAFT_649814 [Mycena metata]|uniref:Uncharacterized protein n=1 Tax=Mycena metata TaxID=1033252 RepID=A0AAD7NE64_9AGAR|nr:hypothetical protein B0H16DRAFT_649814 [Mycena metata]
MLSDFPQELIERFIEEIGPDASALRSCALVCRAFAASSQRLIFSELVIAITPETCNVERLLDVLLHSPHLAAYVHTLKIVVIFNQQNRHEPILWSPAVAPILDLLRHVKSFTLRFPERRTQTDWGSIPKELKAAICGLCHQSRLESLHLIGLGFVPDPAEFAQLVTSSALKELSFIGVTIPPSSEHRPETKGLTTCYLELGLSPLDFVAIWGDSLSSVRNLRLMWPQDIESSRSPQTLLNAVSPSLEDLHLDYYRPFSQGSSNAVSLANSTKLRRLVLRVHINGPFITRFELYNSVRGWEDLLQSACSPALSTVVITIIVDFFDDITTPQPIIPWPLLDELLAGPRFPSLGNVEFQVKLQPYPGVLGPQYSLQQTQFVEVLRAELPRTRARGIFQCNEI